MTKDRILLLESYISFYTLGALTDDSDDVLVLNQTLYDGTTFQLKDLVSKSFDVKSFESSVSFNIMSSNKLSKLRKPTIPYKLQIGSSVRYKNKSYQVIGYFYNEFAQLNIISPILFNPSNVVTDVANLFYGLKSNKEVKDIINDNFVAGKYSNDIVFPLTIGVKNYKKQLSNIQAPPFTSLDSLTIKKKEEIKVGEPLIPYQFDTNQFSKIRLKSILEELEQNGKITKSDINFYLDLKTFRDLIEKRIPNDEDYKNFGYEFYKSNNRIKDGELPLLPYNIVLDSKLQTLKDNYVYNTPIGNLHPIMRVGSPLINMSYKNERLFGIYNCNNRIAYSSFMIQKLLFTQYGKESYASKVAYDSKDFIDGEEYDLKNRQNLVNKRRLYSLKENTFYGGFYATSGTPELNSTNDEKILPFGTIFKNRGIYYYVLSYLNTNIGTNEYCLCIKASTRNKIIDLGFAFSSTLRTEIKANYRKFTTEEVYNAFKKEGHIFDIDDSYYSLPQSAEGIKEQKEEMPNTTLVTDVFLTKRAEQFEVLQSNFPQLSDTFLGILSVLDKSLSKPKITNLLEEKGLVYLQLDSVNDSNTNRSKYDEEQNNAFKEKLKKVGERKLDETLQILKSAKGSENISDKILNLATDTYKIQMEDESSLYIALKSYEDFQKYALSRIAINLKDNYELFVRNKRMIWNNRRINFPSHNSFSSLSLNCFLGTLNNLYVNGISQDGSDQDIPKFYLKKEDTYNKRFEIKVFEKASTYEKNAFAYSQFIFVYSALDILYRNAHRMIMATHNGQFDSFIQNENFVREIRQYDLSISLDFIKNNVKKMTFFYQSERSFVSYERLGDKAKILYQVFDRNIYFEFPSKEDLSTFKTLIKNLDKIYGGVFNLEERIIKNKSNEILKNFPKISKKEQEIEEAEEMYDDTDLFEDAFEELGDEFLENIEELDIDELI